MLQAIRLHKLRFRRAKFTPLLLVIQICLIFCTTSALPCFAGDAKEIESTSDNGPAPLEKIEVITLGSREKAESFAGELEKSGYKTIVVRGDKGDNPGYKVYILLDKKNRNIPKFSDEQPQGQGENKTSEDKGTGYEAGQKPSWELFDRPHHYIHASLSLSGIYTDNALNSRTDKQSDFSTMLSPSIWIVYPNTDSSRNVEPLSLSLRSPGGSLLTRQWPDSPCITRLLFITIPVFP